VNDKISEVFIASFLMVGVSKLGKVAGHRSVEEMGEENGHSNQTLPEMDKRNQILD
jgi:hypothetical protein